MLVYAVVLILKAVTTLVSATSPVWPTPDRELRAQYCLIKNEIPTELIVSPGQYEFQILNSSNQVAILYDDKNENDRFTALKNLSPNHFPIAYLRNKELYRNYNIVGFIKENYSSNPLGTNLWNPRVNKAMGSSNKANFFFEIPLKYYFKEEFISNKIFIYTKKVITKSSQSSLEITQIKFQAPLPSGLTIRVVKNIISDDLYDYYSNLKFENSNNEPIIFVKEFEKPIVNSFLIKQGYYPYYIGNNKSCFGYNLENTEKPNELDRKRFLEEMTKEYATTVELILLKIKNETILDSLKNEVVFNKIPFGYIFKGNGLSKRNCNLEISSLARGEVREENIKTSKELPDQIVIPDEQVTKINVLLNKKITKLSVIKRYVKNPDWTPFKIKEETIEYIDEKYKKEIYKKDRLKLVPVIKSPSLYRDENLICIISVK